MSEPTHEKYRRWAEELHEESRSADPPQDVDVEGTVPSAWYWKAKTERDALAAKLSERERELAAAHVELGRHLCYTSHHAQRDFWTQVEDRANRATHSDSEESE